MKLKLSNPKYGALLIALITAAIATLLFVLLPGSANLTAAYIFCLIGIVLMEGGFLLASTKNVAASFALIGKTGKFLPWSLTVSAIVLVLERIRLFTMPAVWHVAIQVILLAISTISLVQVFSGAAYIDQVEEQVAHKRNAWGDIINRADMLVARAVETENKAALKKVADALRYADPMSVAASQEIEARIVTLLGQVQSENCCAKCGELLPLIQDRNTILRKSKQQI